MPTKPNMPSDIHSRIFHSSANSARGIRLPAWANNQYKKKPRQEICAPLKWFCFLLNFIIFVCGLTNMALGVYLWNKDPRSVDEWVDVVLNPAIVLTLSGLLICFTSLCGLFGALRDNIVLLKTFALCIATAYILLVIATFILFMLFYTDTAESLSAHHVLLYFVRNYHSNRNIADLVDYLQEQLKCCGVSSSAQGFRDWNFNEQFQCNQSSLYPEKCGVPFSCCRKSVVSENSASGALNPLLPAIRSIQCWQGVQLKKESELEADLFLRGCLQPLKALFEKYAVYIGAIVAISVLPVCIGVCLSQCLARQIDYQRYLLHKEAKRFERRKKREDRYLAERRTTQNDEGTQSKATANVHSVEDLMENGALADSSAREGKLTQLAHKKCSSNLSANAQTRKVAHAAANGNDGGTKPRNTRLKDIEKSRDENDTRRLGRKSTGDSPARTKRRKNDAANEQQSSLQPKIQSGRHRQPAKDVLASDANAQCCQVNGKSISKEGKPRYQRFLQQSDFSKKGDAYSPKCPHQKQGTQSFNH